MKKLSSAFIITFIYFLISFMWILFSDKALLMITQNNEILTDIQTLKGWFFVTITSIFLYFLISKALTKEKDLKNYFRKSLDNLATPIIILSEDGNILTINKTFEKLSAYKKEEIKTTAELLNIISKENYPNTKKLIDSLFKSDCVIDNGIFHIKSKSGKTLIWNIYSSPYGVRMNKKIIILNAIDVTEIKEKEQLLMQQSKMAAMGEVLENIAHQWRQPLSNISTISTGIELKINLDILDKNEINESMKLINNSAQYLSKTIDDFRSFFKPTKEKTNFTIKNTLDKSILIIGNKFKHENIEFVEDLENFTILNDNNALIQVFINIFNNSKDAFIENKTQDRYIFIKSYKKDENLLIKIKDNAGGIDENIINNIFEAYFTTKDNSLGTGIGLYMSEEIIVKHMQGKISVENSEFNYKEKLQKGALFTLTLPLKI